MLLKEDDTMKGNDWLVSIFVGVVLSLVVVAFLATRFAGG